MTKHLLILSLFVSSFFTAAAQVSDLQNSKPAFIEFSNSAVDSDALPFSKIVVIDLRFDTSKFGYLPGGRYYQRLVTKEPFALHVAKQLNKRYEKHLNASTKQILLIIIKRYWTSSSGATNTTEKIGVEHSLSQTNTLFETFAKSENGYMPLVRVDSVFEKEAKKSKSYVLPFDYLISHSSRFQVQPTRKPMNEAAFVAYYSNRFLAERFRDNSTEKGLYLTFKDFLNKKVSKKEFSIKNGSLTDELFIKEGDKEILFEKFWGYCDGQQEYIKLGYNLYPLLPQDRTYDLLGSTHLTRSSFSKSPLLYDYTTTAARPGPKVPFGYSAKVKNVLKPFQLDMETGLVY